VADGDTLLVLPDQAHEAIKLRIQGIDAPERCQPGGDASRDALIDLVHRKTVQVIPHGTDTYGRVLGRVEIDGRDGAPRWWRPAWPGLTAFVPAPGLTLA
jgi:endonuclease YncB( thermonuclease family)